VESTLLKGRGVGKREGPTTKLRELQSNTWEGDTY
jgi:hypothetical protein